MLKGIIYNRCNLSIENINMYLFMDKLLILL